MSKIAAIACLLLVGCATARPPQLVPASVLQAEAAPAARLELAPPSAVAPTPAPRPRKYYAAPMVVLDLLLFVTIVPVMQGIDERAGGDGSTAAGVSALYVGGYLFGGPLIHNAYGNKRQQGRSFLRRIGYPVLFGFGGALVGAVAEGDCNGEFCGLAPVLFGVIGGGIGMVVAVIHDWTTAHD